LQRRNILENLVDYEKYKHDIPVILVDDVEIARHHLSAEQLESGLASSPSAIVVMAKYPVAGQVKTRLMPALSAEHAARVQREFLRHVVARLAPRRVIVCVDPPASEQDMRRLVEAEVILQSGGDLGARLAAATLAARRVSQNLIFLGVDSPDVPIDFIDRIAALLLQHDLVIAPADDGGYWAVALAPRVDAKKLFAGIEWSTGREAAQTLERAKHLGYNVAVADPWPDVDRPADLFQLIERLKRSAEPDDRKLLARLDFVPPPPPPPPPLGRELCDMTQENPTKPATSADAATNPENFLPQSTILIVDDNAQNVELLQAFLESLPVRIVTAFDGVDALEKVQEHNPDLILLDIMMPRMSGFQVCRKLKGEPKTRDIQVLMVTALNELGDIEQASECGTDDFVSKPVNKLELLTRVKSLLRVRHMKSELERALTYLNEIEHDDEEEDVL
jgi:rSAM/selenodomain-associated transferase 1